MDAFDALIGVGLESDARWTAINSEEAITKTRARSLVKSKEPHVAALSFGAFSFYKHQLVNDQNTHPN
jgi:hypothetical protein